MNPSIVAVSQNSLHEFSKHNQSSIWLLAGLGVEDDAHMGEKVQHLSRVAENPDQTNLRQVHLVAQELLNELKEFGYEILPGDLGENICTCNVDLLSLPVGTLLHLGDQAIVELTGLRNPCWQIENFRTGLLEKVVGRNKNGEIERKAGVMAVVIASGIVKPKDVLRVVLPDPPHKKLERV